jgi:hypothetical protein
MTIKERYLWVVFIAAIILVSLYFRYYYQPSVSMNISIGSVPAAVYPYQEVKIPITISNTGSSTIDNISIGLYTNGNTTNVYRAHLPAGKQTVIYYNFTPASNGTYTISMVADPERLYDITNRQAAQSSTTVTVLPATKPEPYSYFPSNYVGRDIFYMSPRGYEASLIFDNFTKYLLITESPQANNLIYPVLDVLSPYLSQIVVAHGYYSNYSLTSIWLQGYINQNTIDAAAIGKGFNVTDYNGTSTINFGNDTTLCASYSGGWTKLLVSLYGSNCTAYSSGPAANQSYTSPYYSLKNRNDSLLNYDGYSGNLMYAGDIAVASNSLVFESLMKGVNFDNTCYGNIYNFSNISYCMQNFYQGNVTASELSRLVGGYNVSIWWVSSPSTLQEGTNYAFNLSRSYGPSKNGTVFVSAYANKCIFTNGILCQNPQFASNETALRISLQIVNGFNSTLAINSAGCSLEGNFIPSKMATTITPGKNATIYVPCYNYGTEINSSIVPISIPLNTELNYSHNGTTNTAYGLTEVSR